MFDGGNYPWHNFEQPSSKVHAFTPGEISRNGPEEQLSSAELAFSSLSLARVDSTM